MTRQHRTGVYIIAMFGLIYVMANAGNLPSPLSFVAGIVAVVATIGLVAASRMAEPTQLRGPAFDRRYWLIVAGEIVVGLAGLVVINAVLGAHAVSVAWISLVVGIHFFGLYATWRLPIMIWVGAAITLCGAAGLVAGAMNQPIALISTVAGLLPGAVLLAAGWWSVATHARADETRV